MIVRIFISNNRKIEIDNFTELTCTGDGGSVEALDIQKLYIYPGYFYHFKGSETVVIEGRNIEYISYS